MKKNKKVPEGVTEDEAISLWRATLRDYDLDDQGVEILRVAVMALNNTLRCQQMLDRTNPVYSVKGTGLVKLNPIMHSLWRERSAFLAAMKQLDLQTDDSPRPNIGRPLRKIG
jgi:hypothetical protein